MKLLSGGKPQNHTELIKKRDQINHYYEGVMEGLWMFAWWKNGIQYVGSCGTTLEEARAEINLEQEQTLKMLL